MDLDISSKLNQIRQFLSSSEEDWRKATDILVELIDDIEFIAKDNEYSDILLHLNNVLTGFDNITKRCVKDFYGENGDQDLFKEMSNAESEYRKILTES